MNVIGLDSVETLIWCFAGGVVAACVYAFYAKGVIGKLIRALIAKNAFDEASAVTAEAAGCKSFIYRFALRKGSIQNGAVTATADGRYYVTSDAKDKLLSKYGSGSDSLLQLVLVLVLVIVAVVLIAALYPMVAERFVDMWNS